MADKKIVVVAVEDQPQQPFTVGAADLPKVRPLIRYLLESLEALPGRSYTYDVDYVGERVGGDPGSDPNTGLLQRALTDHLEKIPHRPPSLILVPIASAASKAAKAVVDRYHSEDRIPIVFTVVSDPRGERILDGTPRITGVSRNLIDTARAAVGRFADCLGRPCQIHYCWRHGTHQGDESHRRITQPAPPDGVTPSPQDIPINPGTGRKDCGSIVRILNQIPPGGGSPPAGLFMIADDLVGTCAAQIIHVAHARKIPTFFQQLEWVCAGDWNPRGPFGLAGYGVTPRWIGEQAATVVDPVLRNPDAATDRKVVYPADRDLRFWINRDTVRHLKVRIAGEVLGQAEVCPPPPPPSRPALGATRAAAQARPARREARKRTPRRKPAAGRAKAARKPPKRGRTRRAAKGTAPRRGRLGGRRPKQK